MGQDTRAQWLSNVIVSHVLCTRLSIFSCTAGPVPEFLVPIPCMVLTYHLQEGNCNTKEWSIWFPLAHPCFYKQNTFTSQSFTISGFLSKNGTVFILYWYWLLQIIHMFLFVQDRAIIKGALQPKVTVWPALTSAKWKVLENLLPWSRSCYSVCICLCEG